MAHLLHIDTSPRGDRSISRALTKSFVQQWKTIHSEDTVTYRDLGHYPVPHVDESWIAAAFTPESQLTADLSLAVQASDDLIDELLKADYYLLGVPMYNLSIPSTLKAYLDQIVRVNKTFMIGENGYEGLLKDKKMVVITARGGGYPKGTPMEHYDFQEPYLKAIFGMIGITDITFIHTENVNSGEPERQQAIASSGNAIQSIIENW